ncbi:MAG TPA: trans-aconitate 2-methyltransferase [Actinophytocola sp.]|uniref:trans-aconitate 2-methyltransferase n=1 Tax=Actinophytocola sp. TaxID=1872138 RepID=UPI002DDCBCF5|nr:trans-aconitate 2-methyltransferase [Actinophytocola sp.]HEV2782591.1 trans-aconitate 2-methyltransferase [Actinophytocola sp.]
MWDPGSYLVFDDYRARPFRDLVHRIGAEAPRRIVDIGCGAGNRTLELVARWPAAAIEAFDSSPEMVAAARERGIAAEVADVRDWTPAPDTDVAVTNAVLQWIPDHPELLRRWAGQLPAGAWFAMQVPGNFAAPSHVLLRAQIADPAWRSRLDGVTVRDVNAVLDPEGYARLFAEAGYAVDAWETTYLHRMSGADPVLEWMTGTAMRPIKSVLSDADWHEFRAALAPGLRAAYPVRPDGSTWFPFRRVFVVARAPA